ncbi:Macrophage colony-stimulating factor 1 receptor [Hypsibius exemplaris]|uniref:Macrophage colony-stimulating factor 1 receptor n=1 Tax=Hypsibius exemplaris TaxID=2072580 RepID=A0A1W0WT06_HYPEX|nr:Macrophage colony-stimulating factor 1 receptor [Hypsibius exemplaris]
MSLVLIIIFSVLVEFVRTAEFSIIFRDDFNGERLNSSIWNVADFTNDEQLIFKPDNVRARDGFLHLEARRGVVAGNRTFTSGQVDTMGKFEFLYGEIEWRARVPRGQGLWSALQLFPFSCKVGMSCEDWPPSVSVLDARGDRLRESVVTAYYKQSVTGKTRSVGKPVVHPVDMSLDFHVYKLVWDSQNLSWWIDGIYIFNISGRRVPSVHMQAAMSLAVGGSFAGAPDKRTRFPAEFLIDYVEVRQSLMENSTSDSSGLAGNQGRKRKPAVWFPIVIAFSGILIGILFSVALLCCVRRKKRKDKKRKDMQLKLMAALSSVLPENSTMMQISQLYNVSSGSDSGNSSHFVPDEISPYFRLLEVPLNNLEISEDLLGKGQFGSVWRGLLKNKDGRSDCVVAIKRVLDSCDPNQEDLQCKLFLDEMKVMTKVGRHLNIVNLLGTVTVGKPMMIMEFCSHGSLLKYLQSHRHHFQNVFDHSTLGPDIEPSGALGPDREPSGALDSDRGPSEPSGPLGLNRGPSGPISPVSPCAPGYVSMMSWQTPVTALSTNHSIDDQLDTDDLIHMVYQIARGLEYLAEKSIIHRDLAARNVLVCEKNIVKICDFGLARQRMLADYILLNEQVALPIKWMAPESIFEKRFSYKSDIWSFGILMWEIFSLGQTPYTSAAGSGFKGHIIEFAEAISNGLRMGRPSYAPDYIYEIMCRCWNIDKVVRPSASDLRLELGHHMPLDRTDYYLKLDEPYQHYNQINAGLLAVALSADVTVDDETRLDGYVPSFH